MSSVIPYELSQQEIFRMTSYKRTSNQAKALAALGIPSVKRVDNTLLVLRAHLENPPSIINVGEKSDRPKLKPIKK